MIDLSFSCNFYHIGFGNEDVSNDILFDLSIYIDIYNQAEFSRS